MNKYELFKKAIVKFVERFRQVDKSEPLMVVSHLDADGIAAGAIMLKTLKNDGRIFSSRIVQQLRKEIINELKTSQCKYFVFVDIGSEQLENLSELMDGRVCFILDHHRPKEIHVKENIIHLNPYLFDIDGSSEISGAGVTFLFAKEFDDKNVALVHLAVIGAIADNQEHNGFIRLNNEILEDAVNYNQLRVKYGLKLFGAFSKPLHKVLEYSTDIFIPNVTGSERGALAFLSNCGISPKIEHGWRKYELLTKDKVKMLVDGISQRMIGKTNIMDLIGPVYMLVNEDKDSPYYDAREFSTVLNACCRMNKSALGIGICLNDKKMKKKGELELSNYKQKLVEAFKWYKDNEKTPNVVKGKGYIIINTHDNILSTLAGTLGSLIAKSVKTPVNTLVMSLAELIDNNTKISLRIAGHEPRQDIDLRKVLMEITAKVGGEAGGHKHAAGAIVPTSKEEEFVKVAKEVLARHAMEESVGV